MNKKNMFLLLAIATTLFISSCKGQSSSSAATSGLNSLTTQGGDWILKIDDMTIYEDQFNKEFEFALTMRGATAEQIALTKNNPTAKQQYLDELIGQVLLLKDPESETFFNDPENVAFLESAFRSFKIQYYTQKLMEEAVLDIPEPTQDQIAGVYEQNKVALAQQYGITELNSQTIPYISQMIKGEQAQQKVLIMVSDLKDKSIIDRNKELIEITPTATDINSMTSTQSDSNQSDVLR